MRTSLLLQLVIAVAATNTQTSHAGAQFCKCERECIEMTQSTGEVRIKLSKAENDTIFCVSKNESKWVLGWDSDEKPVNISIVDDLVSGSHQNETNYQSPYNKTCPSLTVRQWYATWTTSHLFVSCQEKGTNSKWFQLNATSSTFDIRYNDPKHTEKLDILRNKLRTQLPSHEDEDGHGRTEGPEPNTTGSTVRGEAMTSINGSPTTTSAHAPADKTVIYAVAGGAAGCVALLLTLVIVLMRKVKEQRKTLEMTNDEIDEFMLGIAAEKAQSKGINGLFVLPYDTKLEIPKSDVTFRSTVLGSGAFGQVIKGAYQGRPVAIKMLKNNANQSADYLRSLLGELKVMSYLGSHPYLVGLIGSITANIKGGEVYLLFEFCSNGNVHSYVRGHRESFMDLVAGPALSKTLGTGRTPRFASVFTTVSKGVPLTTKDLVRWAFEIASGMEYVSSKNVYHGDLAARNILLTETFTAKVGDFGLSKQLDMEKYNCYVQKKECPLPLKWMAIESLRDLTFSIQSDVWSYGVTLWELFTLGAVPYPGMEWNFESWKLLREGKRLDKPDYASDEIYDAMMQCWAADPKTRPGFAQLRDMMYAELYKL